MFDTIFGLPVHALVVHGTVVLVPLAALTVLLAAVWPAFRRWAGPLPLGASLIGLILLPISMESGEALERNVGEGPLVETHAELAESLAPWMIALTVLAAALAWFWLRERRAAGSSGSGAARPGRGVAAAVAVLAVVAALGTSVQVARIGHSGAEAAWSDVVTQNAAPGDEDD